MKKLNIAILIPAFNEAKYIDKVISDCINQLSLDIIIVDDGSTDNTINIVEEKIKYFKNKKFNKIILLKHVKNQGKGEALKTGFSYALNNNYDGVITIDADGQHKVSEINNFLKIINEKNPDIIVGSRFKNTKGMPFLRLATNIFTSWLISAIAGKRIEDVQSGFRYLSKKVIESIKIETSNFDTEPEILLKASWQNFLIINVPITTIYHTNFISYVNPIKDTIKFFKLVFKSFIWKRKIKRSGTKL